MDIFWVVMRGVGLVVLGLYVLVLGAAPLMDFIGEPRWVLGLWLACIPLIVGLGVWLLQVFSWWVFAVWLGLLLVFHAGFWLVEDVGRAIEVDRCLDMGGVWYDAVCDLKEPEREGVMP